jgi:putative hydrolase of the HAD superfamily
MGLPKLFLFDLDDTLYPRELGLVSRIDRRIEEYMVRRLGFAEAEVPEVRRRYWDEHGSTLRGLMNRFDVDPDEYLGFVHAIPLEDLLGPDPCLLAALEGIPARRAVFTNASRHHAERVLRLLGVERAFEAVFGLEDLGYAPKPSPEAYRRVLERLALPPGECVLVEDSLRNLLAARAFGMRTVWVCDHPPSDAPVDHAIPRVHDLPRVFGPHDRS